MRGLINDSIPRVTNLLPDSPESSGESTAASVGSIDIKFSELFTVNKVWWEVFKVNRASPVVAFLLNLLSLL